MSPTRDIKRAKTRKESPDLDLSRIGAGEPNTPIQIRHLDRPSNIALRARINKNTSGVPDRTHSRPGTQARILHASDSGDLSLFHSEDVVPGQLSIFRSPPSSTNSPTSNPQIDASQIYAGGQIPRKNLVRSPVARRKIYPLHLLGSGETRPGYTPQSAVSHWFNQTNGQTRDLSLLDAGEMAPGEKNWPSQPGVVKKLETRTRDDHLQSMILVGILSVNEKGEINVSKEMDTFDDEEDDEKEEDEDDGDGEDV